MAKVAIVTGGTRGIGAAISTRLKADGYAVAAVYGSNDEVAAAFKKANDVETYKFDVADPDAAAAGVKQIEADLGPTELLVNNAGITRDAMFHRMTYEQWSAVINTNLGSMFAMTRPVIEGMRDRSSGRIVNISSINGQKGQLGQANYSAAKAGVIGFTKTLALENARKGVNVNCICPGYIDTEMVQAVPEKVLEGIIAQIPMGRLGKAEEVAAMVAYLASPEAGFITGAVMTMNGAQYMANG
jgi:acetoacetyl-CoA reductase